MIGVLLNGICTGLALCTEVARHLDQSGIEPHLMVLQQHHAFTLFVLLLSLERLLIALVQRLSGLGRCCWLLLLVLAEQTFRRVISRQASWLRVKRRQDLEGWLGDLVDERDLILVRLAKLRLLIKR